MNLPTLPTDNLYKFMAIFGLIIFLSGIYLIERTNNNLHEARLEKNLAEIKHKNDSIIYNGYIEIAKVTLEEKSTNKPHTDEYHSNIDNQINRLLGLSKDFSSSGKDLFKTESEYQHYLEKSKDYEIYANVLGILGVMLIMLGFRLWYKKHQIYIDAERKWKGEIFVELLTDAENEESVVTPVEDSKEEKE